MSLSEVMLKTLIPSNFLDSDDDEEIKSLTSGNSSGDLGNTEFNVFNDYFGLINLVQNTRIHNENYGFMDRGRYSSFDQLASRRDRFDSIDSENSSGSDTFSDNGISLVDSAFHLPPFSTTSLQDELRTRSKEILPPSKRGKPSTRLGLAVTTAATTARHVCVFCRNNGESEAVYASHVLKGADGKTTCPILRAYTCPICKCSGDDSHTIKYCPLNNQVQQGATTGAPVQVSNPKPLRSRTLPSKKNGITIR